MRLVNVDANRKMTRDYGIRYVPTFVYVRDGKEIRRRTGWQSERKLMQMCSDSWVWF